MLPPPVGLCIPVLYPAQAKHGTAVRIHNDKLKSPVQFTDSFDVETYENDGSGAGTWSFGAFDSVTSDSLVEFTGGNDPLYNLAGSLATSSVIDLFINRDTTFKTSAGSLEIWNYSGADQYELDTYDGNTNLTGTVRGNFSFWRRGGRRGRSSWRHCWRAAMGGNLMARGAGCGHNRGHDNASDWDYWRDGFVSD